MCILRYLPLDYYNTIPIWQENKEIIAKKNNTNIAERKL